MKLFLSGILIGIGKILPGISGSVLAIRLGIYEKVMDSILHFFKDWQRNITYLGILGSGFLFSTILGSKVLLQLFLKYGFFLKVIFIVLYVIENERVIVMRVLYSPSDIKVRLKG